MRQDCDRVLAHKRSFHSGDLVDKLRALGVDLTPDAIATIELKIKEIIK